MRPKMLLPLVMIALAALACDGATTYNTVFVAGLSADPDQPGHIRALLRGQVGFLDGPESDSALETTDSAYVTTDGGQSWAPGEPFEPGENALALRWEGDRLLAGAETLWAYPRSGFRTFFYEWTGESSDFTVAYYQPRLGGLANIIVGDTLYVSLGTEGLLVGPAPGSGSARPWALIQNLPDLRPLPLHFRDPLTVLGVILAALLIPPLPLIHAYLLSRVWRYLMPAQEAGRHALRLSLGFAALAAAAVFLWITPTSFDIGYFPMVIGVGLIVIIVGTVMTVRQARAAGLAARGQWQAGLAAAGVSAIVPLGVLAVWLAWWGLALVISGYAAMAWLARRHLRRNGLLSDPATRQMHWQTDRLALQLLALTGLAALVMIFVSPRLRSFAGFSLGSLTDLVVELALLALATVLVCWRLNRAGLRHAAAPNPAYRPAGWVAPAVGIVVWLAVTGALAAAVFAGQVWAAEWFNTLMAP